MHVGGVAGSGVSSVRQGCKQQAGGLHSSDRERGRAAQGPRRVWVFFTGPGLRGGHSDQHMHGAASQALWPHRMMLVMSFSLEGEEGTEFCPRSLFSTSSWSWAGDRKGVNSWKTGRWNRVSITEFDIRRWARKKES